MSTTIRLFANDNRISTAVKYPSGSVFQVFPSKTNFSNENAWKSSWEASMRPQIAVHDTFTVQNNPRRPRINKMRLMLNGNRISTAVMSGGSVLQVYPSKCTFASAQAWRDSWVNKMMPSITVKCDAPKSASMMRSKNKTVNWHFHKMTNRQFLLPAGEYYIGDLCYVLGDDVYDNVFGGTGYEAGLYQEKGTGRTFLVNNTAYGDGEYTGSDGNKFAVDAGIIGICPKSLMTKNDGGGHMYTFRKPVDCRLYDGEFTFTDGYSYISINTN
jgi:hypothetical protein